VASHDPLHNGQSHPCAGLVADAPLKDLERREQPAGHGGVEAAAVVADEEHPFAGVDHTQLDARALHAGGVLPGVPEEVLQHDGDEPGVGQGSHAVGDDHADARPGIAGANVADDEVGDRRKVDVGYAH